MLNRLTRTGLRLFVLTAPAGVAVLAVATDTPVVMLLVAVPGAVVLYVLHLDRHRAAGTVARAPAPSTARGRAPAVPPPRSGPADHRAGGRRDDRSA